MECQGKTPKAAHFPSISTQHSMSNLPEELITAILLKLPVESLWKVRSVSKSWLSLITSPDFVKTHLLLSASNKDYTHHRVMCNVYARNDVKDCSLRSLFYDSVTEAFDLDCPGKGPNIRTQVVGSVNGMICLAMGRRYNLFLWNPSIRKYKKLPKMRLSVTDDYYWDRHVDFKFGFAYDEFQDDYKVVGIIPIITYEGVSRVEVQTYGLKSDSWRRIVDLQGRDLSHVSGKLVNGKLHWFYRDHMAPEGPRYNIVSFDFTDEKWREVEQPSFSKGSGFVVLKVLGVFGSDLSVFCNHELRNADIWVMKEYGVKESWTKMFTIKCPSDACTIFYPPSLMSNEGQILLRYGSTLVKYNLTDDSISYVDVTNFASCHEAEIYVKSLVCPWL